ncbi:MAG TPA: hypothetical protein VGH04_15775 [Gemmatimonadaceae bacterium]|jgi:hypothetical protein
MGMPAEARRRWSAQDARDLQRGQAAGSDARLVIELPSLFEECAEFRAEM